MPKTLLFCTSRVVPDRNPAHQWETRYRTWLDAIKASGLRYDQILMVDDASPSLPEWSDLRVACASEQPPGDGITLYTFAEHLGRRSASNFPGWVRSFFYAAMHAERHGFDRIIHLESDAFLISPRIVDYFNGLADGWVGLWCPRWNRPESAVQFIGGSALPAFKAMAARDVEEFANIVIEDVIPFTHVEHGFIGDRYGECLDHIPRDADWSGQTVPRANSDRREFFWWLRKSPLGDLRPHFKTALAGASHTGLYYLDAIERIARRINARSYFEIGTLDGQSLRRVNCEAVCVDPEFRLGAESIKRTAPLHLYQMTSDKFFRTGALARIYPCGMDIAYIDGLHLFENVLRDFMKVEEHCHKDAVILIHDALPLNARMAERQRRFGGEDEPTTIRDWWTGDVWKPLFVLKRWRPDLRIEVLNCPPTGLVQVTNLNPRSTTLSDHEGEIMESGSVCDRDMEWLDPLWHIFPMVDTRRMFGEAEPRLTP